MVTIDEETNLHPLEYILNNNVEILIQSQDSTNGINPIIDILNYYGIIYDYNIISKVCNTIIIRIDKKELDVLSKEQKCNLLNSIFDISKNRFVDIQILTYDLGYNPYQE